MTAWPLPASSSVEGYPICEEYNPPHQRPLVYGASGFPFLADQRSPKEAESQPLEKKSYLVRLPEELQTNVEWFEGQKKFAEKSRAILRRFLEALNNPSTSDADLWRDMTNCVSDGTFLASYNPSHAAFNDLKSTGNLDIIRDRGLREALVQLHAICDDGIEAFDTNSSWALQMDDEVYVRVDVLRFDSRTSTFFPQQSTAVTASHIRDNVNLLRALSEPGDRLATAPGRKQDSTPAASSPRPAQLAAGQRSVARPSG